MSALPYIPLYVADYLADTSHLSTIEHGAYLLLIMNYWQRGNGLPANDLQLARIARLTPKEWAKVKPSLVEFFDEQEGLWTHNRVEQELGKVRAKSQQASSAGKISSQRKASKRSTDVEHPLNHTDTDTDTDKKKDISSGQSPDLTLEGFEDFWKAYPKRDGSADRKGAMKTYRTALKRADFATILAGAEAYCIECRAKNKFGTEFVKQARTWLNADGWTETYGTETNQSREENIRILRA